MAVPSARSAPQEVHDPGVQKDIDRGWKNYPQGFVAHLQPGDVPPGGKGLAEYLAKYVVSPPISVRRIKDTTANKSVTGARITKQTPSNTRPCPPCVSSAAWSSTSCPRASNAFATSACTATLDTRQSASGWPPCCRVPRPAIREVDRHLRDPAHLRGIVDHQPAHDLAVRAVRRVTSHIEQLQELLLLDRLVDVAANRAPRGQVLPDPIPAWNQVNVDRLAIRGPHRALMHRLGRADGHAVAAVDAEVPRVRDRNRVPLLRDQPAGTCPDAAAASDAEALVCLDNRFHRPPQLVAVA